MVGFSHGVLEARFDNAEEQRINRLRVRLSTEVKVAVAERERGREPGRDAGAVVEAEAVAELTELVADFLDRLCYSGQGASVCQFVRETVGFLKTCGEIGTKLRERRAADVAVFVVLDFGYIPTKVPSEIAIVFSGRFSFDALLQRIHRAASQVKRQRVARCNLQD